VISSATDDNDATQGSYLAAVTLQKPKFSHVRWQWQFVCSVNSREINLEQFSYVTVKLNVAFKICQQIQNSRWCRDFALFRSLPLELTEVSGLAVAIAFVLCAVYIFLYRAQTASVSQNFSAKLHLPLQIGCHTRQDIHSRAGTARSVQRLAMGWTVRGSNPSGRRKFPHPSIVALGPIQPPKHWVMGLSRG